MPLKVEKKDFEKEYQDKGAYHHDQEGFKKFFLDVNYKLLAEPIKPTDKVLDVACGDGAFSDYLPTDDITGIDNAPTAIKYAKELQKKGKYIVMDMENLEFEPNTFDAITCSLSLFYFDESNIDKVLQEIKKVLKPNGKFIFSYKNLDHPKIQEYITKLDSTMESFSLGELKEILARNGFEIEKIVGTNLMLDLSEVPEEKLPEIYELSRKIAYYLPKESYHFVVYSKINKKL
jgi:ubiquinone/menaquinone biosynthesis C-methylase UbiE